MTRVPPSVKIFGDVAIPRTEYVVLERVLAAYRWCREDMLEVYRQVSDALQDNQSSVRLWWRVTQFREPNSDLGPCYISLNPPEHRTDLPDEPCEIRDLEVTEPPIKCRDILHTARGWCHRIPPITSREASLIKAADSFFDPSQNSNGRELLIQISEAASKASDEEFKPMWSEFYQRGLFEFGLTRMDFASATLLLQFQRCSGLWVLDEWYSEPHKFLNGLVYKLASSPEHRNKLLTILPNEANSEFKTARKELKEALTSCTMEEMTSRLMLSSHRFQSALMLYLSGIKLGAKADSFEFSQNLAEEGLVCINTGISLGAEFCTWDKDALSLMWLEECGPSLPSLTRRASEWSSSICPVFTRTFSQILAAQALCLSRDLEHVRTAVDEFRRLERTLIDRDQGGYVEFERSWIDQCLLHAFSRLGDESAVHRYARRIAGRLILARVLNPNLNTSGSGEPQKDPD